ncbi:hypothetical protein BAZSYMB_SCAFFOLD00101_9 [Bathymodiolus azoricus thioautotrophic gill symbiont]|uniref:Uncharacterized protein n=1 Tax=Bathymodiolus azoricus thioautotrophic gill symbiont TaxID=235205 RepID=A0A1H6LUJ8_9GAMM|nr:hypothetical protein BAZSYMB_SCAFFOLD00101_9 [Bathymodiolus azoricus thioautotrophic gill symbiont]
MGILSDIKKPISRDRLHVFGSSSWARTSDKWINSPLLFSS